MPKFTTVRERLDSDFIKALNALAEDGWHVIDSGYTDARYNAVWWATLRKDTD